MGEDVSVIAKKITLNRQIIFSFIEMTYLFTPATFVIRIENKLATFIR